MSVHSYFKVCIEPVSAFRSTCHASRGELGLHLHETWSQPKVYFPRGRIGLEPRENSGPADFASLPDFSDELYSI